MKNRKLSLTIGWLYPELMSTYGDRGNIIVLQKRCEWRGIEPEIKKLDLGFKIEDLRKCDLLFMGGAQDRQQKIVSEDLREKADVLSKLIQDDIPGLYICGAYQFLGKYYKEADGTIIEGLGIFDLYTESPGENSARLIGNIVASLCHPELVSGSQDSNLRQNDIKRETIVGFENHGGRTYLEKGVQPLATVKVGFGNNGNQPRLDGGQAGDKTEGAVYKNSFGSYMHGPILPKNPHFADLLIKLALEKKYLPANATHKALQAGKKAIDLSLLNDSLEWQAHNSIVNKLRIKL